MRKTFYLVVILALSLSAVSCRKWILEDRTECPSFLFFDIKNAASFNTYDDVWVNLMSSPGQKELDADTTTVRGIQDKEFYFVVRKQNAVTGYGLIGSESMTRDGDSWIVPQGWDYANLFRFQYTANVMPESFTVPVEFFKEYCHVKVQFVGIETFHLAAGKFPFDVVVKANTCGINPLTGIPVEGPYEYAPAEGKLGQFEFTLPRMYDSRLVLELYGREGLSEWQGHVATFNLYQIIGEQGGVTWQEPNLPDVELTIDYQEKIVDVLVSPWQQSIIDYEF